MWGALDISDYTSLPIFIIYDLKSYNAYQDMKKTDELFSTVLCKGRLCTYDEVIDLFGKLNVVSYSVQYPNGSGDKLYKVAGSHMVHKLMRSPQKRGVYHMVIDNPIRILKTPETRRARCVAVVNSDYRRNQEEYSLGLPGDCDLPSGLYECSLTLTVSDPNWDIYQFIAVDIPFDDARVTNLECPECTGELTLKVIKNVGPFPSFKKTSLWENFQLPDSVKAIISEFKTTFEI